MRTQYRRSLAFALSDGDTSEFTLFLFDVPPLSIISLSTFATTLYSLISSFLRSGCLVLVGLMIN